MVGGAIAAFARVAGAGCDVGFDADDGLDAAGGGFAVEVDRAVEGAVVSHGDGFLAKRLHPVHKGDHLAHAVEERELGVSV